MELPVVDISSKQVQPYMYEPVLVMSQQSEDDSLDSDDTASDDDGRFSQRIGNDRHTD